jgi:hypothetical protein
MAWSNSLKHPLHNIILPFFKRFTDNGPPCNDIAYQRQPRPERPPPVHAGSTLPELYDNVRK